MTATSADLPSPPGAGRDRSVTRPSLMWQVGTSAILAVSWPIGLALFIVWTVVVSLSLLTVVIPLLVPVAAAIRAYAQAHREWAGRVLGQRIVRTPVIGPADNRPRNRDPGLTGTLTAPLRDPATWREWLWLPVNATVGFALALLPVVLLASVGFYLCYPLLYALTPQEAFGTVLGIFELHSVSDAWLVTPLAGVCLVLWWTTARALPAANASIMRAMLGSRTVGDQI